MYSDLGSPRIYVSSVDYALSVGIKSWTNIYVQVGEGTELFHTDNRMSRSHWGLNSTAGETYTLPDFNTQVNKIYFQIMFDSQDDTNSPWQYAAGSKPTQLNNFLQTANSFFILGHRFYSETGQNQLESQQFSGIGVGSAGNHIDSQSYYNGVADGIAVVNDKGMDGDGYSLFLVDSWTETDPTYFYGYEFMFNNFDNNTGTTSWVGGSSPFTMGCLVPCTYFDFPNSPDLGVEQFFRFDGIETVTTTGGQTLTNINYAKSPPFGKNSAPFYNSTDLDTNFDLVRQTGKKGWRVTFSMMPEWLIFPYYAHGHISGEYDDTSDTFTFNTDTTQVYKDISNFVGTFLTKSLGGKLKFIWQPNNTVDEYYICRIPENSISITQQTVNFYKISFVVEEAW